MIYVLSLCFRVKMSTQQAALAQAEAHVDQLRVQASLERMQVSVASKEYVFGNIPTHGRGIGNLPDHMCL